MGSDRKEAPRIKIYSGLTLDEATVHRLLPAAVFAPPARKEDIFGDVRAGFNVIAIVDGVFHQAPAVSCGEIMDALRAGVRVYGSSSMGALRASELDRYGMIGHGRIYEHIKSADCFRDDYLGQIHHADRRTDRRASVPYVDFHFALLDLMASGRASRADVAFLAKAYSRLHYTERNPTALRAVLVRGKPSARFAELADAAMGMESQKKKDAVGLLKRIKTELAAIERLNQALNSNR